MIYNNNVSNSNNNISENNKNSAIIIKPLYNSTISFSLPHPTSPPPPSLPQLRSGETAAIVAKELAEQTKGLLRPGDVPSTVRAMAQLVELLDSQLRNLTPGGKDSAARSLTKVMQGRWRR